MNNNSIIPPPPIFWKYTAHLLRRTLKINAQRIKDTPALYFQLTPCICTVYFRKAFFAIDNASTASSISKRLFLHYTAHLVRCCAQINPHRIKISINGCKNINSG